MGITLFRRRSQIEKLCDQSGVHFRYRDGPLYGVFHEGRPPGSYTAITVSYQDKLDWTKFTCSLPVTFPLGRAPDGLFARAMMRSIKLKYSDWLMDIRKSSNAELYLCANWPTQWLTPASFGAICQELGDEAKSFHQEIRDKFSIGGRSGGGYAHAEVRQAGPGVPVLVPNIVPRRYQ